MKFKIVSVVAFIFIMLINIDRAEAQKDTIIIHFDYNRSEITPVAKSVIDNYISNNLSGYKINGIDLNGHCDYIGNNTYNDSLSKARVDAVENYLINKNIDKKYFAEVEGSGKRYPLNDNSDELKRAINRRVVIVINKSKIETAIIAKPPKKVVQQKDSVFTKITDPDVKVGNNIILKNLNFIGGRHIPLEESYPVMDEVLDALRSYPNLKIEIQGYVCCTPEGGEGMDFDTRHYDLSLQRAKLLYDYLVQSGIDKKRLSYKGFGGSNKLYPLEQNETERQLNRRVEVKILAK